MADQIERDTYCGAKHPAWTEGLTREDRPTIPITPVDRGRVRWGLHSVVAFATTVLVLTGLAKGFSGSDRGALVRAFSDAPRAKVTTSGIMFSQRPGSLSNLPDCNTVPTKSGKQICWEQ